MIVNGKLMAVHPGWNRLALGIARTQTLKIELFGTKRPKTGSAGGGGIRELRVPGMKVDELLRPPVLAEQALRGADLGRTPLEYLFDRFTADRPGQRGPLAGPAQAGLARDARDPEPQLARTIEPPAAAALDRRRLGACGREGLGRRHRPAGRGDGRGQRDIVVALRQPAGLSRVVGVRRRSGDRLGRASGSPGSPRGCNGRRGGR